MFLGQRREKLKPENQSSSDTQKKCVYMRSNCQRTGTVYEIQNNLVKRKRPGEWFLPFCLAFRVCAASRKYKFRLAYLSPPAKWWR